MSGRCRTVFKTSRLFVVLLGWLFVRSDTWFQTDPAQAPEGHQGSHLQSACPKEGRQTQRPSGHIRIHGCSGHPTSLLVASESKAESPLIGLEVCPARVGKEVGSGCPPLFLSPGPLSSLSSLGHPLLLVWQVTATERLSRLNPSGLKSLELSRPSIFLNKAV